MMVTEIEFSTPVLAYQAIRRKLLSLRRRKPTVDDVETNTERSTKRRREFAPPEVIKRLSGDNHVRKVGVMASVHVGENGTAVFLMPLHGKASESLTSLLETFHSVQAPQKPVVDGLLTSTTVNVPPRVVGVAAGGESGPTAVPESPLLQGAEPVAASYSSDSSSETVEGPELDPDRSDVFGPIDFNSTCRPKERLTSVSSEMSVVSNTTVIWVGSLTPVPAQAGSSRTDMHFKRPPSEITVDWQDASAGEQDEELTEGNTSPLSISPGSPKTMHVKTPGQSGMPSPNVEIYSMANTPKATHSNTLHTTQTPAEGKTVVTIPDGTDSQEKQVISEGGKKQERPVVPFFYGSKIPVMTGKPSGYKNTYGSLIAHQRRVSGGDIPSSNPKSSAPKPHSCTATPLAAPRPRALSRTQTAPVRVLTRRDTITGHFPGTPPKPIVTTAPTSGGSPRPRSSSKIPIPSPTTPKAIIPEGKKFKDILAFGESILGDIAEADCENDAIWERRRDDVMGPLGVSPTTRLGGFLRPASLTQNPRAASMPMASLVGTAMASNDVTKS